MGKIDHFKIVGHYGGITSCGRVQGTRLFCGFGPELAIFDISTPEKPERRGNILLDEMSIIENIYVTDSRAYVSVEYDETLASGGLYVIDIGNRQEPRVVNYLSPGRRPSTVAGEGDYIYLALLDEGLEVANATELNFSSVISRFKPISKPGHLYPRVHDVAVRNRHAYVCSSGLDILDISDPHCPQHTFHIDLPVDNSAIHKDLLVITGEEALTVFDVSRPVQPVVLGSCRLKVWDGFTKEIVVYEDLVAVTGSDPRGEGHLHLFDISAPSVPRYLTGLPLAGVSIAATEGYLYTATDSGRIAIVNVSDRRRPLDNRGWLTPRFVERVLAESELAYVTGGDYFYVLDIRDPLRPITLSVFSSGRAILGIDVVGTRVFLTEGFWRTDAMAENEIPRGLRILDLADPRQPQSRSFYELDGSGIPYDVAIQGNNAYILWGIPNYDTNTYTAEILRLDISDPSNIRQTGKKTIPGEMGIHIGATRLCENNEVASTAERLLVEFERVQLHLDDCRLSFAVGPAYDSKQNGHQLKTVAVVPGSTQKGDLILEAAGVRGLFIRERPAGAQMARQLQLPLV